MAQDKIAEVFTDERRMQELIRTIEKMEAGISKLAGTIGSVADQAERTSKAVDDMDSTVDKLEDVVDLVEDLHDISERTLTTWDKFSQRLKSIVADGGIKKFLDDVQNAGWAMSRMHASPENVIDSVISRMPFGGFVNLMLESKKNELKFDAMGRESLTKFRGSDASLTAGDITSRGGALGGRLKELGMFGEAPASPEEMMSVYETMATGGAKEQQMTRLVATEIKGFGQTVAEVSLGTDKAFGLVAGSAAKLATELRDNTGVTLEHSVDLVNRLGRGALSTSRTVQEFTGMILQTTSALRMQGSEAESLASTYTNLEKSIAGALRPGDDAQRRAGVLAEAALGDVGAYTSNISDGQRAVIGRSVAEKMGIDTRGMSDMDVVLAMKNGFQLQGANRDPSKQKTSFQEATMVESWNMLGNMSGTDKATYMTQTGMSPILAEALKQFAGRNNGDISGLFSSKEWQNAVKANTTANDEAALNKPLTKSGFDQMMEDIKSLMQAVGETMIRLLGTISYTLIGGFELLARLFMADNSTQRGIVFDEYIAGLSENTDKLGTAASGIAKRAAVAGTDLADAFLGLTGRRSGADGATFFMSKDGKERYDAAADGDGPLSTAKKSIKMLRDMASGEAAKRVNEELKNRQTVVEFPDHITVPASGTATVIRFSPYFDHVQNIPTNITPSID